MFDLEQLVTAHLQQAGQGVLSINHQKGFREVSWSDPQIKYIL